ncbi:MAG: aromatic amino acid hydroxylase [Luteibaculaceae bacterium]
MSGNFESNNILKNLPKHLYSLIIDQPYNDYTAQDHAVWRYVMRQNVEYLGRVAHKSYLDGLQKTGISVDTIPHMYGMNRILKEIGWAAVSVDGFIPPQAFMEFQAYNVLVIAADIRNINHIKYTPAPDIIHESAGHAPIIADEEYSAYLKRFGEIGAKAISSAKDYELYEAIRHLSIIKENHNTPQEKIQLAEERIDWLLQNMGEPSEMSRLRNLHWWTVEYGLIGSVDDYKIYGAGLLSSIGESKNCMKSSVKKLPYTLEAADYSFDITNEQPQLFVTPSFEHLTQVLEEFSETMAFKRGGIYGLQLGQDSKGMVTVTLDSGAQISGLLTDFKAVGEQIIYLKFSEACQLAYQNKQLKNHGKEAHTEGYSMILGNPENFTEKPMHQFSIEELKNKGLEVGAQVEFIYPNGVSLNGELLKITPNPDKPAETLMLSFKNCTVKQGETFWFKPEWGVFDLLLGNSIPSVSAGLADPEAFGFVFEIPKEKTEKLIYNSQEQALFKLYAKVRKQREENAYNEAELSAIATQLKVDYPKDWLLTLEIFELASVFGSSSFTNALHERLQKLKENRDLTVLIEDGLKLTKANFLLNYDVHSV